MLATLRDILSPFPLPPLSFCVISPNFFTLAIITAAFIDNPSVNFKDFTAINASNHSSINWFILAILAYVAAPY